MRREFRVDQGSLRKPTRTPQGFLRADGYASRVGIFEYLNDDGTIRRELRLPEEVFRADTLAGFEGATITDGHPPVMVSLDNVKKYERGTVTGAARRDGDWVVTPIVINDAALIRKIERGDNGLSVGYSIKLDETPGVHPQYGRYDAIQRDLVINHLAGAVTPRAGNGARVRMDGVERVAQRADSLARLTDAVDGHQHLIDVEGSCGPYGGDGRSGSTSWAVSDGADIGHDHPWVRNADGSITIGESSGHTHTILDDNRYAAPRADQQIDRPRTTQEGGRMDPKELQARIDELTGENKQLQARIKTLEGDLAAGAQAAESDKIKAEAKRADEAEAKIQRFDDTFAARVKDRVKLEREAGAIMGPEFRLDDMEDRAILEVVVKRLDATLDVKACNDGELRGHYRALLKLNAQRADSERRITEILGRQDGYTPGAGNGGGAGGQQPVQSYEEHEKNAWKTTLKNGRAAAEGR